MKELKVALIGYGRMGHMIEEILLERGHRVVCTITEENREELSRLEPKEVDVAIEFTAPASARENCLTLIKKGIPLVSGTTGWPEGVREVEQWVEQQGGSFVYASNFSIGVNLFFALNRQLARLMSKQPSYEAKIEETHHIHKLDAPSGTAITLAEGLIQESERYHTWALLPSDSLASDSLPIEAFREGEVSGIHQVVYRSAEDEVSIRHEAFSRRGFAYGAVLAAEYAYEHRGNHSMQDVLGL